MKHAAGLVPASLRALWFGVIPALLAAASFRHLLPASVVTHEGALRWLAELRRDQALLVLALLFLFFAALIRYWRAWLPQARYWAGLERRAITARAALGLAALIAAAGLLGVLFRGSLVQTYRVLSGSMLPSFEPGSVLLGYKSAYGFRPFGLGKASQLPKRGDVVIFHRPSGGGAPDELVKRVIGLPGDTITVRLGYVTINGWDVPTCEAGRYVYVQDESLLDARLRVEFLDDAVYLVAFALNVESIPFDNYTVKPGEIFVLGDNRSTSIDSRAWNEGKGGGLRPEQIRGRVGRFLFDAGRNGEPDYSKAFRALGLELEATGIDFSPTRAAVARCLADRPKKTRPPPPGTAPPVASGPQGAKP